MKIEERLSELEKKLKEDAEILKTYRDGYYKRDDWTRELEERIEKTTTQIVGSSLLYLENLKYLKDISVSLERIDKYLSKEKGKMLGEINSLTIDNHSLFEKNEKLKRGVI